MKIIWSKFHYNGSDTYIAISSYFEGNFLQEHVFPILGNRLFRGPQCGKLFSKVKLVELGCLLSGFNYTDSAFVTSDGQLWNISRTARYTQPLDILLHRETKEQGLRISNTRSWILSRRPGVSPSARNVTQVSDKFPTLQPPPVS